MSISSPIQGPTPKPARDAEPPRILVVDDEPAVCDLLKDFLEARGYTVITASSGPEALRAVEAERPRLILLDVLMPEMSGLEALTRVRQIDRTLGVIMLTAVVDERIAQEAMQQGAYDYVTKPVDLGYLELSILTWLAQ